MPPRHPFFRGFETGLLFCLILVGVFSAAWCQEKKTFTVNMEYTPGNERTLLDPFQRLTGEFENELRRTAAVYTAAEVLFHQDRYEEAGRLFKQATTQAKKSKFLAQAAVIREAESLLQQGRFNEALKVAREASSSENRFVVAEGWFAIARAYVGQGNTERAEEAYKSMLAVNPSYEGALKIDLLAGMIALNKGDFARAAAFFQRHPEDVPSLYYTIACYCALKDVGKATPVYQKLLAKAKRGEWIDRARILIGEAIYQQKDYDLANTFFTPVARKGAPQALRVLALYRQACIDFHKKDYTHCELTLQSLLREYPNHSLRTDWFYLIATIPVYQRDWVRTIREESRYVKRAGGVAPAPQAIPPDQLVPEAAFRVIWAHMALGDYQDVITEADRFYKKYPKNLLTSYSLLLQGVAYDQVGNFEKALDSYQTLVDLFPMTPAAGKAVYLMTLSLHKAQEPSRIVSALNHLNDSLQRNRELQSDPWRKNTLFWIAEGYYTIQDYKNAERTYKKFVELSPENKLTPYALQGLASSIAAQGPERLNQARIFEQQALTRAQELGNNTVAQDAQLQMARLYFNTKDYEKAMSFFDSSIQSTTDTFKVAEALYQQGLALYHQQYYSEAINRWKQIVDSYKAATQRVQAYFQIGRTHFGLAHFDQAIATYQSLRANYPNTPEAQEALFQLIHSYYNKGDLRGAYQQFMAFKTGYPTDDRIKPTAELLLTAYQNQGQGLRSGELSELLRSSPGSQTASTILWERGAALFNKKDYAAAQKYFQRIMLSYPNDEYAAQAYFYNAECHFFLNNMEEAIPAYKSFYYNYPAHTLVPQAMSQVGVCHFNKKDYLKGAEAFEEFLKKYSSHNLAKDAALNLALCHKKAFKLDEAIKAYQNFLRLFPNDAKGPFVLLQLGSLYSTQGEFTRAIEHFDRIPSNTVERLEAQFHIGEAYAQLRDTARTRGAYEKLRGMGPRDNEFRIAGLLELAKMYEQAGAAHQMLLVVYEDIASSSRNQDIVLLAQQKISEFKNSQGGVKQP